MEKRNCMYCLNKYSFGINQCEIPNPGIKGRSHSGIANENGGWILIKELNNYIDENNKKYNKDAIEYIQNHFNNAVHFRDDNILYCLPEFNKKQDCYFYKSYPGILKYFIPIVRFLFL